MRSGFKQFFKLVLFSKFYVIKAVVGNLFHVKDRKGIKFSILGYNGPHSLLNYAVAMYRQDHRNAFLSEVFHNEHVGFIMKREKCSF